MHFPKFSRTTPSVGNSAPDVPPATETPPANGHSATEGTRPGSTTPAAPRNTSSGVRPNTGTSKLFAFKKLFAHAESLPDWARHGEPGEQRPVAATTIKIAQQLTDSDILYGDYDDCDLRGLNLKTLPVPLLLKLHANVTVRIDSSKLSAETVEALTAGVMKKGYNGPTFEPGPKNENQKAAELRKNSSKQVPDAGDEPFREERAAEPLPRKPAKTGISVAAMAGSDGAIQAVQALLVKGFSRAQLKQLHVDIREYVNHGDLNNGADWFQEKYGDVFDQPISEPGASPKYAKLLNQLLKV